MTETKMEKILKNRVDLLQHFFFGTKCWSVLIWFIILVISCVASYFTLNISLAHYICGCVTAIVFVFFLLAILRLFNRYLTIEEAEAVFALDRQAVYDELFKTLTLEKLRSKYQAEPIEIMCPEETQLFGKYQILYRYFKKLNKVYYSKVGYKWLLFGEKSMFYYYASVDRVRGFTGYEVSHEFDYKDIVSIKTEVTHDDNREKFTLTISLTNGEILEIPLRDRPDKIAESNPIITHKLTEKEAQILSTIRQVIRTSK